MTAPRNDATEAQVRAARPGVSTWLAANAGSGKTRVLTDRVARLLLGGVDPQQILCLTYTKAAASEMQNRLFKRLGEWAMLPDPKLRSALDELGHEGQIGTEALAEARTLFARAIETPGGLKIQTIHSFCAGLLRRFPIEAGVNPDFKEMEDRDAEILRLQIVDEIATGPESEKFVALTAQYSGENIGALTSEIVSNQAILRDDLDWPTCAAALGAPEHFEPSDLENLVFNGDERALLDRMLPVLAQSGTTDQKLGAKLAQVRDLDQSAIPLLAEALLTKDLTPRKTFPAKGAKALLTADMPAIVSLTERLVDALRARSTFEMARQTFVFRRFAALFLRHYALAKKRGGVMDFDDLILSTRTLLSDAQAAAWVMYRLDGGISHILVDEAQDTSPAQWDVIRCLAQEFTAGEGAQDSVERTVFVVGDKKQSIYSFQGADPEEFHRMQADFAARLAAVDRPMAQAELAYSFRSSPAILRAVDETFAHASEAGFDGKEGHKAFHRDLPGRVDLWPHIEPTKDDADPPHWSDPVDRRAQTHHSVIMGEAVANEIAALLDPESPTFIPDGKGARPIRPGDIMILVQKRSGLFHEIIRACKALDLPIAGADVLKVGAELAVRDLLALLSFLDTAEDDLALACALRSPLFGWTEQDLFTLAHGRDGTTLWQVLREQADEYPQTLAILRDLRNQIDFLRPYELIDRILTRHDGRRALLARLGPEAEDGVDALLAQALSFEQASIPSLTGFLVWAKTDDLKIKRQFDSASNLIRVMTVHGAKGLESKIVFLPDCASIRSPNRGNTLKGEDQVFWKSGEVPTPIPVEAAQDARAAREQNERLRLLYVAMTRAENWLIVGAAGQLSKDQSDWYQTVSAAMEHLPTVPAAFLTGEGLRYETGNWPLAASEQAELEPSEAPCVLDPLFSVPAVTPARPLILSPSDLGGAKALPSAQGLPEDLATARGTYIHDLLQAGMGTPISDPPDLSSAMKDEATAEAAAVLSDPALAWIFAPGSLAEVEVTAPFGSSRIEGSIDRLIVTEEDIWAVDFKSNQTVPDTAEQCPEAILRQMGAYCTVLAQIYPNRTIRTGVLWTRTRVFHELSQKAVIAALDRARVLDEVPAQT